VSTRSLLGTFLPFGRGTMSPAVPIIAHMSSCAAFLRTFSTVAAPFGFFVVGCCSPQSRPVTEEPLVAETEMPVARLSEIGTPKGSRRSQLSSDRCSR